MQNYTSLKKMISAALAFAQKTIPTTSYTVNGKVISVEDLAAMLCVQPDVITNQYRFTLGQYSIRISVGILRKQSYHLRFSIKENNLKCVDFKEEIFPADTVNENNLQYNVTKSILTIIGTAPNLLMANPTNFSFIGFLVDNLSKEQGKGRRLFFNRPRAIERIMKRGDKKELRRILRIEYAEQKNMFIPEARYALQLLSLHLLKQCDEKVAA